jgi:hypothetical protein
MQITHIALWAVNNDENANELIKFTRSIPTETKKDGKAYILAAEAGYNVGRIQVFRCGVKVDSSLQCILPIHGEIESSKTNECYFRTLRL